MASRTVVAAPVKRSTATVSWRKGGVPPKLALVG